MANINIHISSSVSIASINNIGADRQEKDKRAVLISDTCFEDIARKVQDQLDSQGIHVVMFVRDNLLAETTVLEEALAMIRNIHSRMIIGLGGEEVLSFARITAAAFSTVNNAHTLMNNHEIKSLGLHLVEIPTMGNFSLMYTSLAFLSDTHTCQTKLIHLPKFESHTVVIDTSITGERAKETSAQSLVNILAESIESYLSPNATFFSDIQSKTAVQSSITLLLKHKDNCDNSMFLLKEAETAIVSAFSTGLTGLGPIKILAIAVAYLAKSPLPLTYAILLIWALDVEICTRTSQLASITDFLRKKLPPSETLSQTMHKFLESSGLPTQLRDFKTDLNTLSLAAEWAINMMGRDSTPLSETMLRELLEKAF